MDNVTRVMTKIKPDKTEEVWDSLLIDDDMITNIQRGCAPEQWESSLIDIYVNCDPSSSWERLAKVLYRRQHVAAVEEVRTYLPPKGES